MLPNNLSYPPPRHTPTSKVLQVFCMTPNGLQLAKNCCLTLRNFSTERELAACSCEVAITLLRTALQYDERAVQMTSIQVCCHNLAPLHPYHKECIGGYKPEGGIRLVLELIRQRCEASSLPRTFWGCASMACPSLQRPE